MNAARGRAGIVDENIDAAEMTRGFIDKGFRVLRLGEVGRYRQHLAVGRRRISRAASSSGPLRRAQIATLHPSRAKHAGDRLADAGAGARHECLLSVHLEIHVIPVG